ncbi:MAG: hypothetical protein IJ514_06395 [Clostridia bacterium]|nr:hypothetical protein [Clostridia bacterium]
MKIYFLSSQPAALTLNELYFGVTDKFERFAELSLKDNIFVRFTPQNALPIGFFLTEDIRFTPPQGVEVYLLKNAIALYARDFPPADLTLRPVAQLRDGDTLATVFAQGALQLSVQSEKGFFVATLPPAFAQCELFFHLGLILLKTPTALAVYTPKAERVFLENILSYELTDDGLKAVLPLSDRLRRTAECTYLFTEEGCTRTGFILRQENATENAAAELLPYAFFESVLIGANFEEMLADELVLEKENIARFLGDFEAVILTEDANTCGLVRRKGERLFEASYFTVTLQEGKIADIRG